MKVSSLNGESGETRTELSNRRSVNPTSSSFIRLDVIPDERDREEKAGESNNWSSLETKGERS